MGDKRYIIEFEEKEQRHRVYEYYTDEYYIKVNDSPFDIMSESVLTIDSKAMVYAISSNTLAIAESSVAYYQYPFVGCEVPNILPALDKPVHLRLDLTFKDKELKAIPSYKIYTEENINQMIGERAGHAGVLVVHNMYGEYMSFDLTCPVEMDKNIKVSVNDEILYATCPKCGTKYDIGFNKGIPETKEKSPLIPYKIGPSGNALTVSNWR